MKPQAGILYSALAFYAAWTAATWYFEGRIETLLRPEATGDRIIYAFAVNLLFGIAGGIALLRHWKRRGTLDTARAGFGSVKRVAAAMGAGLCLGLAAYVLQGAPSMNPVVIVNAFAQVLVVSAAEVLVCWALVGAAAEALLQRHGRVVPAVLASLLASILFGVYHYAHSAPFNTLQMVLLLTAVGLVTSAFFFASRDLAGTIVFHNFLGTFGVAQALSAANALSSLERLQAPLLFTAVMTACFLLAGYVILRRTGSRT
ncbi:MAG: hypothetical protein MOGDAGHF_02121 [Rhodocyclaceae bacterium]|jgi:membrane protease YdiL (CAAX protease family)|nr:hypothetical protein [Rhodocyclaceae bacterium]